ncbi:hypothetical protein BC829DRAFT_392766 [Chytridium lagenaria]|nr:hypothetical protein BC829DRAFT_392766 [Chytridium lagenaria]
MHLSAQLVVLSAKTSKSPTTAIPKLSNLFAGYLQEEPKSATSQTYSSWTPGQGIPSASLFQSARLETKTHKANSEPPDQARLERQKAEALHSCLPKDRLRLEKVSYQSWWGGGLQLSLKWRAWAQVVAFLTEKCLSFPRTSSAVDAAAAGSAVAAAVAAVEDAWHLRDSF